MEVRDRQQLGFPLLKPGARRGALTLGAVAVAATVIGDERVAAFFVLTTRNMPAERSCPAALDRTHHLQLTEAHVTGIGATPRRPEVAKDIRDLQRGARQQRRRLCRRFDLICIS